MTAASDIPCSCQDCVRGRATGGESFVIIVEPTVEMPCDQCVNAFPPWTCIFCNSTGIARRASTRYEPEG